MDKFMATVSKESISYAFALKSYDQACVEYFLKVFRTNWFICKSISVSIYQGVVFLHNLSLSSSRKANLLKKKSL